MMHGPVHVYINKTFIVFRRFKKVAYDLFFALGNFKEFLILKLIKWLNIKNTRK